MRRTVILSFLDIGRRVQGVEQGFNHGTRGPGTARAPIVCGNQDICAWIAFSDIEQCDRALGVVRECGEIISERIPFIREVDLETISICTCRLVRVVCR